MCRPVGEALTKYRLHHASGLPPMQDKSLATISASAGQRKRTRADNLDARNTSGCWRFPNNSALFMFPCKMHRTPFLRASTYRAERALDLVHGDLCGPGTPTSPGGSKYFMLIVDDFGRYMWLELLRARMRHFASSRRSKRWRKLIEA
jgi:hypothetical protein